MSEAPDFYDRIRASVAADTGKQVGYSRIPEEAELGGTTLELPYCIMNPIVESFREASMEDAHDSGEIVIQFTSVGSTPRQARWMANKVFDALTNKTAGGAYRVALVPDSDKLEWRLCDQRGAILPTGPNLFNEQDNYRLRRGA